MVTNEEIKEIVKKNKLSDVEQIAVIQRFIFDKKGKEVKINRPQDIYRLQLMNQMYDVALKYYVVEVFKNNLE
jgi:chromosome segregation and condensation protein ScpB